MRNLTRKEQKERTKLGLIEVAENLFSRNGIGITTTADIAKACKISHGTVFIHFPTRDELILAVVDKFGERLSAKFGRRFDPNMDLNELLHSHVSVLSEFEDFYMRLISESQSLPPQIRGQLYALNASLSYRFYQAAKSGMKSGELKKIDQAHFANTWLAILHYHIINRDLFSEKTPILKYKGDELIKHFFALIKAK
ncbi:MAG: TetR/AcrR family transcriptional regulator [Pseudobdellovibrionaceae bacterium]